MKLDACSGYIPYLSIPIDAWFASALVISFVLENLSRQFSIVVLEALYILRQQLARQWHLLFRTHRALVRQHYKKINTNSAFLMKTSHQTGLR